ncbi:MAG: AsmA family protein [Alphaproteobacteria bacterium]|nr:AsmA family protein [Alphaproteobacteria bacterium]
MATDHHPGHRSIWERDADAFTRHWRRLRDHAQARWQRTRWSWSLFWRWAATVFVVVLLSAVAWLYFLDWNTMRGPVGRYLSHRLGREVKIEGDLKVHLFTWTPNLTADRVTVRNPDWVSKDKLAADIGRFAIAIELKPLLFRGKTILPYVTFDKASVLVVRDLSGRTNWELGKSKDGFDLPPIRRFTVSDGHVTIDDAVRKMHFEGTVNSNETRGAGDRAFQLTGDGTLNRNKFTADVHGGALLNVDSSKPYRFAADVHSGSTHIAADGAITRPFHFGQFGAKVTFEGASMADLYYVTGLVLPPSPPYRLESTLTRDGEIYRFEKMHGVVGQSDLAGDMMVNAGQTPTYLQARLGSQRLRFVDLGPFIGARPAASSAKGLPPAKPAAPAASAFLLPDTPLNVDRVRQMNADVTYDAAKVESQDFPLRDFHMHLLLDNGVMTFNPLTFGFARGKLSGRIQVDARQATPVTDLDARLTNLQLAQFMKETPPPVEGTLEARAKLHAVGNSIHKAASHASGAVTFVVPSGRLRKSFAELTGIDVLNGVGLLIAGDKSDTDLRCAVVKFGARDGTLQSEQLVVDTDPVKITGKGSINLRDETMALEVKGEPKEFRIGRIRAPITVGGPWDRPSVGIKASGALAQGGIAAALGLINPFAAILAFVDPGLAKDANCAALTSGAAKGAAPVKPVKAKHPARVKPAKRTRH